MFYCQNSLCHHTFEADQCANAGHCDADESACVTDIHVCPLCFEVATTVSVFDELPSGFTVPAAPTGSDRYVVFTQEYRASTRLRAKAFVELPSRRWRNAAEYEAAARTLRAVEEHESWDTASEGEVPYTCTWCYDGMDLDAPCLCNAQRVERERYDNNAVCDHCHHEGHTLLDCGRA